ncbi:MAG: hypothetical protein IH630_07270 [Thermoplasmata archaeon]|nr:hypothetical protein [Thermoplasmata archaeon]
MGVTLGDPANETVLLQAGVSGVRVFFERLRSLGCDVMFGPSFDEAGQFWYGGITDLEDNPIWVVDANCP